MKISNYILFLLLNTMCLLFSTHLQAQNECSFSNEPFVKSSEVEGLEWEIGENCFDACAQSYTLKGIKVHFHFIDTIGGGRNFPPSIGEEFAEKIVDEANQKILNNNPPGTSAESNFLFIYEGSSFYESEEWCYSDHNFLPMIDGVLNVHMRERCEDWENIPCDDPDAEIDCIGGSYGAGPKFNIFRSYYRYLNEPDHYCQNWPKQRADIFIHEAGHHWTLHHPFDGDKCADTPDGSSNNFMDWNACNHDHFTCCQLQIINGYLDTHQPSYMVEVPGTACEVSFSMNLDDDCLGTFTNTSQMSEGSNIDQLSWCITFDDEEDCEDSYIENEESIIFITECAPKYEICLFVEDNYGCDGWSCETVIIGTPKMEASVKNKDFESFAKFCIEESLIVDMSGSTNIEEYRLTVNELDLEGNVINSSSLDPVWQAFPDNAVFDLSDYNGWSPSGSWMFCPGGNYEIVCQGKNTCGKLSEVLTIPLNLVCCKNSYDPKFDLDFELVIEQIAEAGTYNVTAEKYKTYSSSPSACPVSHDWCLYKLVPSQPMEFISSYTGSMFEVQLTDEHSYAVVHKITSACGERCYLVEIDFKSGTRQTYLDECPLDCGNYCSTPTDLTCEKIDNSTIIYWEEVLVASEYEVELSINDPECCKDGKEVTTLITRDKAYHKFEIDPSKCWSWRVRSVCGEMHSDWSEKICTLGPFDCLDLNRENKESNDDYSSSKIFSLSPNPFHQTLYAVFAPSMNTRSIKLYNTIGVLVKSVEIGPETTSVLLDTEELVPGIYFVALKSEQSILSTQKLIKR